MELRIGDPFTWGKKLDTPVCRVINFLTTGILNSPSGSLDVVTQQLLDNSKYREGLSVAVSFGGGRKRWKGRGSKWKLIQWISRMVLENCTYGRWELRNQFLWNSPCTSKAHTCMPQFVDHWFTIFQLVIILLLYFTIFHRYIK